MFYEETNSNYYIKLMLAASLIELIEEKM